MRTYPENLLVNGNMAGTLTSNAINAGSYWGGMISCIVTNSSSAAGTLTLQGSADGVNYAPLEAGLPGSQVPVALTVSGNGVNNFDVTATGAQNLRVVYVPSGGSGTLNINLWMKGY